MTKIAEVVPDIVAAGPTLRSEKSHLGVQCLCRIVCLNTTGRYGIAFLLFV